MKSAISHIILNGQTIDSDQISAFQAKMMDHRSLPEWGKELYQFINEWFSDSDFVLAQTSGSTGEPKSVELPKSVMIKSAERTISYFGLQPGNHLLLNLPCRYIAGKMMVVRAIVGEMNLISVDPTTNFEFLNQETFDFGAMVPNQVFNLLNQSAGKVKIQHIRNLLVGGSTISKSLEMQIGQLSNRVVSTYGMTETASHIAIRELSGNRETEFYQCLPDISVGLNENGCLQIYLPDLGDPLQTNDLADIQSETSFRIMGRADSVIISGGIKFSPEVIEKKLEDLISQRFLISSVPDAKLGEKLVLIIEGDPFNTNTLEQKLAKILPNFERPKSIMFMNKFQETTSGKIIRRSS
jgi:O-succinylbenzoic acid--CoA ligase